jgi:alcohol dehydrogenase class IV
MAANVQALQERGQDGAALQRYDEVAQLLVGTPKAAAHDGVSWVQALCAALDVPPLSAYGVTADEFPLIIEKGTKSSSMKGNPIKLTTEEMEEILNRAL